MRDWSDVVAFAQIAAAVLLTAAAITFVIGVLALGAPH
jgi:hypothetical protein